MNKSKRKKSLEKYRRKLRPGSTPNQKTLQRIRRTKIDEESEDDDEEDEELEEDEEDESVCNEQENDIDDDDCNARPCKIKFVIINSKERVDWIQCRSCPKWYHKYCVDVDEQVAYLFECEKH